MELKHLFCLLYLVCRVSCGKNSLTLAIDDTASMSDDIGQVRRAAKSIVDIVVKEKSSQIKDIVLVTFNDPGIQFRKRTRNPTELKEALDQINVNGGNDCPEMSLSGIKLAVEESQPGSYIFVFTDASAKDYTLFEEVKALCHEKQSQVVFVLTGDCGYQTSEHYRVYFNLAAATNGQVFRIDKGEVGQVLEYVKETIKGDRTVLVSKVVPPYRWSTVHFNIDDQTEYAIVSASGKNVELIVLNNYNRRVSGYDVITWTNNVKVLKLNGLSPGAYKVMVNGNSDVNVMVFGRTDFTFEHGFSQEVKDSLKFTETQPIIGTETHLMISVKDEEHSVKVQNVEILDMNEQVKATLPLTHVEGNVYATEKFMPSPFMFKVAVTATARNTGKLIRRISKTPVEPIKPIEVAPELSHTETQLETKEGSTIDIHCRIRKGKPKPTVSWYFEQENGNNGFALLSGKTDEVLRLSNVRVNDAGWYKCVAENIAGRDEHTIQLHVKALPAFARTTRIIKIKEKENVKIDCSVTKANPAPTMTWEFKNFESEQFHRVDNTGETFKIFNAQLWNSGFYKCLATNEVGTAHQIIQLIVLVPPIISKENTYLMTTGGSKVSLTCRLTAGNPDPTIKWRRHLKRKDPPFEATGEILYIESAQRKDTGEYTCRAENEAGFDEHTIQLIVQVPPRILPSESILRVKENTTVYLKSNLTKGYPAHTISWYYKPVSGSDFTLIQASAVMVELPNIQVRDSGYYKYIARNSAGQAEKTIQVIVQVPPEFEKITPEITTKSESPVTIECKLKGGNPPPSISWLFRPRETEQFLSLNYYDSILTLPKVQVYHAGEYKCMAINEAGSDEKTTTLTVWEPPAIKINNGPITTVQENSTITLTCKAVKGYPKPDISWWYKDSKSTKYTRVAEKENLRLDVVQLWKAGYYKCTADNLVGLVEATTQVIVTAPPRIVFTPPNTPQSKAVEGDVMLKMECAAVGSPTPSVQWIVNKEVVGTDESQDMFVKGGTLFLRNPRTSHSTEPPHFRSYVCRATNELGEAHQNYEVHVSRYPDTTDRVQVYGVIGQPFDLNCSLPSNGTPIKWFYERPQISEGIQYRRRRATSTVHSVYHNVTGPTIHFDNPTQSDNGNYTCRVSDMEGAASSTVELIFGFPPRTQFSEVDVAWDGEEYEMTCSADLVPGGKFEWYYRDKKIKEASGYDLSIKLNNWGQYVCRVSNPLGSLNITYNVTTTNCVIDKSLLGLETMPLTLDATSSWPNVRKMRQYLVVPQSEKLTLLCQDEAQTKLRAGSFTEFPNTRSIVATCDHEDVFMVDGAPYRFSELSCKNKVISSVISTKQTCLGEDTTLYKVGFHVKGFIDVFKSCLDTVRSLPMYTVVNMTDSNSVEESKGEEQCKIVSDCCYENVQLVNKADVSVGPAESATDIGLLNSVFYCRPHDNSTSWHTIEKQIRQESQMTVWTGAFNYTKVDQILVPQYLWKVVKNLDTEEITAIVHHNARAQVPKLCEDTCSESTWFEPQGSRTYCCELDLFKKVFSVDINF